MVVNMAWTHRFWLCVYCDLGLWVIHVTLCQVNMAWTHRFWLCVYCDLGLWDITLCQGHDQPFSNGQQLCEILSRANMTEKSYGPDTDFGYVRYALWPWPWRYDLGSKSWQYLGQWTTNCVKYLISRASMAVRIEEVISRTQILAMCAIWPWTLRYDLGSRSWQTLTQWATNVWNIMQTRLGGKKLGPGHNVKRWKERKIDRQLLSRTHRCAIDDFEPGSYLHVQGQASWSQCL